MAKFCMQTRDNHMQDMCISIGVVVTKIVGHFNF